MNPFTLWTSLSVWTKRIIVICGSCVLITLIVAAAMTGNLDELIALIGGNNGQ